MAKNNKMPAIRFSGYTDVWEQRKFKDIAFKRGKISEANLPYVEFEDINSGIGTLNKNISQKIGHKKGILFETGDVLFGKLRPYLQNWLLCQFTGIAVGDFWVLHPQNVSPAFLYYLIQSEAYQSVANISSGTKMPRSSWSLVSETQFSIPKYNEANMIGEFFSSIDKNITLHQRKLEKLKLTKKALLQKLFPQNGSNIPELRFKGFTDVWEQRKLGSIGSTYTGLSGKTKEDFGHGEAQYITYLNVFQNTVSDITMTDKVEIDITQNEVKYGDVLFTTSSETPEEVGMSSVWLGHMPNIYLNSFCFGFRPNQKIDPYFLGYSLRAPYMRDKIKILAQGISRYNISKNKVMELEISLPNNEEQRLLGNFLRNIDLSITLHQRKLEMLKNVKKGLLQKMFV